MARVIPPHAQPAKLAMISALASLEEVDGWRRGVEMHGGADAYFPGERDALAMREAEIRKAEAKRRGKR